jgi:hypothetical protein
VSLLQAISQIHASAAPPSLPRVNGTLPPASRQGGMTNDTAVADASDAG